MIKQRLIAIQVLVAGALVLSACGGSESTETPTLTINEIQAHAVETFSSALTQTARANPTAKPVSTLTPAATFPPFSTSTGGVPFGQTSASTSSATACYRLLFVTDVTIPDGTLMTPGQAFTKTWKVKNTGTCAWDAGFKFAFTGGEAMNGTTYTLPSAVPPNGDLDISIAMVAPANKTGTLRGTWQMSTAGGQFFGDNPWVEIVVGGTTGTAATRAATGTSTSGSSPATSTPTATETATPTPTPTK